MPPSDITLPIVNFPEAVTLTHVLTDLDWRRHVAMVPDYQLDRFYKRIAHRLGEPACHGYRNDPIRDWVHHHRGKFAAVREQFWATIRPSWTCPVPFPEK